MSDAGCCEHVTEVVEELEGFVPNMDKAISSPTRSSGGKLSYRAEARREITAALDASWNEHEEAYRYLADRDASAAPPTE